MNGLTVHPSTARQARSSGRTVKLCACPALSDSRDSETSLPPVSELQGSQQSMSSMGRGGFRTRPYMAVSAGTTVFFEFG